MTVVRRSRVKNPTIGSALTLMLAIGCGISVANIYYNQPLLSMIGDNFPHHRHLAAFVPTATQSGYALGLLLLVPLGDRVERRRLILIQWLALLFALVAMVMAPDIYSLMLASVSVGVAASVAQQLLPFAAALASPARRGVTIGLVMSGLLCGILFSRLMAGVVSVHFGWRATYIVGVVLVGIMGIAMLKRLPAMPPQTEVSYLALIRSLPQLWKEEPALRHATFQQGCLFGSFCVFWTTLALHLTSRYQLGADVAGLFGLLGLASIVFAPLAGRLADKYGARSVVAAACVVMLMGWGVLGMVHTLVSMVAGALLLDLAAQAAQVANQHCIQSLRPDARNRLNAVMMTGMFSGGALASFAASVAWLTGGWLSVCLLGAGCALFAIGVYVAPRAVRQP